MAGIKLSGGQSEAPNGKLMGPVKWSRFHLDVILDIGRRRFVSRRFVSRRVVGWRVGHAESAARFKALTSDAMARPAVPPDQLTLHAATIRPWGAPMKAKATALMPADPGVVKSHSRPHTSKDNPFSASPLQDPEISAAIPVNGSKPSTRPTPSAAASSPGLPRTIITQASGS